VQAMLSGGFPFHQFIMFKLSKKPKQCFESKQFFSEKKRERKWKILKTCDFKTQLSLFSNIGKFIVSM